MSKNETSSPQSMDHYLSNIAHLVEQADEAEAFLEVDWQSPVLRLITSAQKEWYINRHDQSEQIWLASPVSGAHHFSCQKNGWLNREGVSFAHLLAKEIEMLTTLQIDFEEA